MMGIMMYLNDNDVFSTLKQIEAISDQHTVICLREPIGIDQRLTLKEFYSEELRDSYNAIYRTRNELMAMMSDSLLCKGFYVAKEGFLFPESELKNRKETDQYYYLLKR